MGELLDNYDLWERNEREREEALEKLPKCDLCEEPITDEYFYNLDGTFICEQCMDEYYRKRTEDFTEE